MANDEGDRERGGKGSVELPDNRRLEVSLKGLLGVVGCLSSRVWILELVDATMG